MDPIPITILGGSDRKRSRLPEAGRALHPLAAYKGAALRADGVPLALLLAERLVESGGFAPVTIAGPARIFDPLIRDLWRSEHAPPRVIDTDSTVAQNLRAAIEDHVAEDDGPLAILACDVLPTVSELTELRLAFERERPLALWLPFIASPPDPAKLGAFAWKPKYRVAPRDGGEPLPILPGHIAILKPARLRVKLLFSLMDAAYRTRNRPVASRRWAILWRVSGSLLWADLLELVRLRPPTRTYSVVSAGLRISKDLRSRELGQTDLEGLVADVFLHRAWRHLERPINLPILDVLSLAEDIDTEEEAAALATELYTQGE